VASIPSRACCVLPAARPVGRILLPWGFGPLRRDPALAPCGTECHVRPGSTLRLSQPLSGFVASSGCAALFRAATVRGVSPSEVSPRRNRAPLSRPACSLVVIHRRAKTHPSEPYHRRFHRRPRPRAQLPGFADDYEVPFRTPRRASRSLQVRASGTVSFRQLHPLRSVDPPASPCARHRVASERRSILSWVFASLEHSPPHLGACDPRTPRETCASSSPEGSDGRRKGPCNPSRQVRPHQTRTTRFDLSADSGPVGTGPNRLSAATPTPLALGHRAHPEP
jgi:hypothetical protein